MRFTAPKTAGFGFYQSHWRLHHRGQPFGQRMICTISVDPNATTIQPPDVPKEDTKKKANLEEALTAVQAIRFADECQVNITNHLRN